MVKLLTNPIDKNVQLFYLQVLETVLHGNTGKFFVERIGIRFVKSLFDPAMQDNNLLFCLFKT
jgi:hypothetical protein